MKLTNILYSGYLGIPFWFILNKNNTKKVGIQEEENSCLFESEAYKGKARKLNKIGMYFTRYFVYILLLLFTIPNFSSNPIVIFFSIIYAVIFVGLFYSVKIWKLNEILSMIIYILIAIFCTFFIMTYADIGILKSCLIYSFQNGVFGFLALYLFKDILKLRNKNAYIIASRKVIYYVL